METIFREEYLQGDQPSLQTIFLTIIHIGHTSILCQFTPWHTSLCFNDFLLQDFASLLQCHCKAVAVALQNVCSKNAVGRQKQNCKRVGTETPETHEGTYEDMRAKWL